MAQIDYDFNSNGTGVILGGNDGTARLNSSLSNPLVGEGSYCRAFHHNAGSNIAMSATLKSSVSGGKFFEIPHTKSISVRAWIRHSDVSAASRAVGIGAKIHAGAPDTNINAPNGYSVFIGDVAQGSSSSNLKFVADNGSGLVQVNIGTPVTDNTWHKVRLDVIPVGTAQDLINVYTGTGTTGSEVWTLRYTRDILNSDPYYIPWAETGNGKVGYWTVHTSSSIHFHIDRFQAFVEDI